MKKSLQTCAFTQSILFIWKYYLTAEMAFFRCFVTSLQLRDTPIDSNQSKLIFHFAKRPIEVRFKFFT